jgi:hypothetical protein
MQYLKCTQLVRDFLNIKAVIPLFEPTLPKIFGCWYVNVFTVDRKKTLIFMNEQTLLSFVVFGVKKSNCSDLGLVFRRGLEQLLCMENLPAYKIKKILQEYAVLQYSKTDSRSALGNLNDLIFHYKYIVLDHGGFDYCDVGNTIHNINRMRNEI